MPILRAARRIGFFYVYGFLRSRLRGSQVAIIRYHRVDRQEKYPWLLPSTVPEVFEQEIRYVRRRFRIVSLHELLDVLLEPKGALTKTAVITIDDGYRDTYANAYPILRKYDVPATVFLATGCIGAHDLFWWDKVGYVAWHTKLKMLELDELGTYPLDSARQRIEAAKSITTVLKRLPGENRDDLVETIVRAGRVDIPEGIGRELVLSWDEIREMSENGIGFGCHTVSHPILSRLPLEAAKKEILDSKKSIEEEVALEVTTFCYPNGEPGDFNKGIKDILRSSGFKCAVTSVPPAFVSPADDLYALPRISGESSFDMFELCLSGVYPDLFVERRRIGRVKRI